MDKTSGTENAGLVLPKTFDKILLMAFNAGVATGEGYPKDGIPDDWRDAKFRAFRDHLAGNPWTMEQWEDAAIKRWADRGATPEFIGHDGASPVELMNDGC